MNSNRKLIYLAVMASLAAPLASAADALKTDKVEVISSTPLPGIGVPLNIMPSNIQTVKSSDVNKQPGVSIADYMMNNMQGVTVSDMTGNPWQPEINFRGYSSSPLLGNSQGLSTYVDGVRVNEPFGDVTLWDKIPSFAIDTMQLVPGSNPLYGLNTLGGAIAVQTKNGRDNQGVGIEYEAGSWGRQRALIEAGGVSKDGSVDYMIGYQHTTEDGWRKHSPSHLNQLFAKTGWQNETTKLNLTYIGTDNNLIGNGFTPQNLLSGDRDQIHTRPDFTNNYSHFLALNGSHWFNDDTMLSGNVYYRKSNRSTKNGDLWELDLTGDSTIRSTIYNPYRFGHGFENDNTCVNANTCSALEGIGGVLNRTKTTQDTYGATAQMTFNQDLFGKKNQFVAGAGYDYTLLRFRQSEQVRVFDEIEATRPGTPTTYPDVFDGSPDNVFDSSRAVILSGEGLLDPRQSTGMTGKQWTARLFANDIISLTDQWHANLGASWNFTRVDNVDTLRGPLSPTNPGSLTDRDSYTRLNPTIGLTYTPNGNQSFFTSYSESSRAPTSIELGCSNPATPCLLPSQMADDPPLNMVVAKTYEVGGRGLLTESVRWNAGLYQAVNHDDIQFTAANQVNGAGYYKNIGRTKRQGLDLGLAGQYEKFKWNASYSYVRATYDSEVEFLNSSNSSADDDSDTYNAKKGDRIPAIPKHQVKLRGQYSVTSDWNIGANIIGFSDQYVWGNENNKHRPNQSICTDTDTADSCALGRGKISGYFVVNLDTQYNIGSGWRAFAKATNIFDRDYNVSGRLAETLFNSAGEFGHESKQLGLLPGAPRAAWFGIRYDFGGSDKPNN